MKTKHIRTYILAACAALISFPMCAVLRAQTQQADLVSASAELTHGLNSKSAKQGQAVTVELTSSVKTGGRMELPKGTKLEGKVADVQNGDTSKLSLVFDQARLSGGRQVPVKVTLLAAYPPEAMDVADSSLPGMVQQPQHISPDEKVQQDPGTLGNITLTGAVASEVSGVFTSPSHNINLHQGTRLQLAIAPETTAMSTGNGS